MGLREVGYVGAVELVEFRWRFLCGACGALGAAVRQRDSGAAVRQRRGRRRGRDDGLPPSFFTRYPPQDVVEVKWRFWLLLTAFAFARFIEVVPILRDRVKNSPGPVALGSRRETAPFCWIIRCSSGDDAFGLMHFLLFA